VSTNRLNPRRKVLLAEFNEITWRLVNPLCQKGKLPTFSRLMEQGTRGAPLATEVPPHLDPWISWTSLYTGRRREDHGVRFLEQPPETVTGPRVWEIAADAGRSVGVFGSIMSWPPRTDVRGFWVPGRFSRAPVTFPRKSARSWS
jgi:predicted AlkP superfamily phosphohydrolase/phosphomutase